MRPSLVLALLLTACAATPSTDRIATVNELRALRRAGDYVAARALLSDDPRQWFERREGDGRPWSVEGGLWKEWDDHFRATSELTGWQDLGDAVTCVVREWNEYYALVERAGPSFVRLTWYFGTDGRIEGLLVSGEEFERAPDRTDEFLAWAREHHSDELEYQRPGGRIDPTGDRAPRTRALANEWRATVGLAPIL